MATRKLLLLSFLLFFFDQANAQTLSTSFYKKTCPKVEAIVKQTTTSFVSRAPSLAAALLRMHFHDCFVRGCDGSVLVNSTANNTAERDSFPNLSLRGFQVIDAAKSAVEKQCPGRVSCADILALAARDAVSQIKGPFWQVPLGRRDGNVSIANEVFANLPPPFFNITQLISSFAAKGLSVKDLVVLSGGHTIGVSHCSSFTNRLYNFTGRNDADPSMDPNYVAALRRRCLPTDTTSIVQMDPGSFDEFDVDYYSIVRKRRGLFTTDAELLNNAETRVYVQEHSTSSQDSTFFKDFAESMEKMGRIGVLTGTAGQIRRICSVVS
ncbi:peroxidase 27 [Phtheirospermum japonicum]|uniref:Peroxidase n=1 Tax=Phtheirospermum japonicum TaxID=374723 RepID=A0A830B3J6_9LAMI|nr:peroxidase 27 [Phtheirospermum japonicum]GFP79529.1 peroxidase 27 [Phtheirospermum japonicum]GFP79530.1 peroxidase 27 [Phtheirospermum japonicum]